MINILLHINYSVKYINLKKKRVQFASTFNIISIISNSSKIIQIGAQNEHLLSSKRKIIKFGTPRKAYEVTHIENTVELTTSFFLRRLKLIFVNPLCNNFPNIFGIINQPN